VNLLLSLSKEDQHLIANVQISKHRPVKNIEHLALNIFIQIKNTKIQGAEGFNIFIFRLRTQTNLERAQSSYVEIKI
jgi:hypothetical protein